MRVLYLSYDGLTDPLGGSQVIPYLAGLVREGHRVHVVSCDKPTRLADHGTELGAHLEGLGIKWSPLYYNKRPPIVSTVWDILRMIVLSLSLHRDSNFNLVHCRSYPASLAGLVLKFLLGLGLVFDMRGFWADEKVDAGAWDLNKSLYHAVYRFFKAMERVVLQHSDVVISLTLAAKAEMLRWNVKGLSAEKIIVIPCCADLDHFRADKVSDQAIEKAREALSLTEDNFVLAYVGSLGSWYLLDEMLRFFRVIATKKPSAKFLFITQDPPAIVYSSLERVGLSPEMVRIASASRDELPTMLQVAHLGIYFRKSVYSSLACSPTKLAEMLSIGLPVVTSPGIGDSQSIAASYQIGPVVEDFLPETLEEVANGVDLAISRPASHYRRIAKNLFDLPEGVRLYNEAYAIASAAY